MHLKKKHVIEFLIVLVILGLLLTVTLPHFFNAQVRSKIALAYSRMDELRGAINLYYAENDRLMLPDNCRGAYYRLTSPVAYLSDIETSVDPFMMEHHSWNRVRSLIDIMFLSVDFMNYRPNKPNKHYAMDYQGRRYKDVLYILFSMGPSIESDFGYSPNQGVFEVFPGYSPTNGIVSPGILLSTNSCSVRW